MREIRLHDYAGLSPAAHAALREQLRGHRTLADVLAWARARTPPVGITEIVTQDEYTHDVVLPLGPRQYLAYATT